jgi:regulator of protease activity HflC (stomatin/prohibitin superfamily)
MRTVYRFVPLLGLAVLTGCGTVPAGYVGVRTQFGAVTGEKVEPGLYFLNPFVQKVALMNCQINAYKADATAATHDLQNVTTTITLNFHLDPDHATQMYASMGWDYGERVLIPSTQEAVKSITANYDATQLITERELVRTAIETTLRTRLARYGIRLDQMSITNFAFDPEFAKAIEEKVVATQNALAAENTLKQKQFEAEQEVATAKGHAEAIRIQAQAIQAQGGQAYVQLQAIEQWNGVLPVYMTGGTPVPFLNIK